MKQKNIFVIIFSYLEQSLLSVFFFTMDMSLVCLIQG